MSEHLDETERLVTDALAAHARTVEPSANAYAQLAGRVATARDETGLRGLGNRLGGSGGLGGGRLGQVALVASMAAVAAAGAGVVLALQDPPPASVTAAPGPDQSTTASPLPADQAATTVVQAAPADGGPTFSPPEATTGSSAEPSVAVGRTRSQAVSAFLDLVDPGGPTSVEIEGDTALVSGLIDDREESFELARLRLVEIETDDGSVSWQVAEAGSDRITITDPVPAAVLNGAVLTVNGAGTGFESSVDLQLISRTDGRIVAVGDAIADRSGSTPEFSGQVPLVNAEEVWLVARAGVGPAAAPFAAIRVEIDAPAESTGYRVIRIPDDDPDGGLRLRAGPGTDNPTRAVLVQGAVVQRARVLPVVNGSTLWWSVETAAGQTGWVAARFLGGSALDEGATRQHTDAMRRVAAGLDAPGHRLPLAPGTEFTVVVDGTRHALDADQLRTDEGWDRPIPELGRSLRQVLAVSPPVDGAPPSFDRALTNPGSVVVADGWFGGLPLATTDHVGGDGAARRLHWVLDARANGNVAVVGVIVEGGA